MVERQYDVMRRERQRQLEEPNSVSKPVVEPIPPPTQATTAPSATPAESGQTSQEVLNEFFFSS